MNGREALALLEHCRDYLSCIPESAAGGDDEAVCLVRSIEAFLTANKAKAPAALYLASSESNK